MPRRPAQREAGADAVVLHCVATRLGSTAPCALPATDVEARMVVAGEVHGGARASQQRLKTADETTALIAEDGAKLVSLSCEPMSLSLTTRTRTRTP